MITQQETAPSAFDVLLNEIYVGLNSPECSHHFIDSAEVAKDQ